MTAVICAATSYQADPNRSIGRMPRRARSTASTSRVFS